LIPLRAFLFGGRLDETKSELPKLIQLSRERQAVVAIEEDRKRPDLAAFDVRF